jgi:hypothetical protein
LHQSPYLEELLSGNASFSTEFNYLFMFLPNSQKANYKISTTKDGKEKRKKNKAT